MGEGVARAITIGSIALTVGSLALAVAFARKKSRIRLGFDLARAAAGIGGILVMAAVTRITTSAGAAVAAIAVGLALGFGQGRVLQISREERGLYARRGPLGVVLWGVGILTMQAAGMASRAGTLRLGQTVAWFSACLGIGLMMGRTRPMRRTLTGGGAAVIVAALVLSAGAVVAAGTAPASAAQAIRMTNQEVCDLTPADRSPTPRIPGALDKAAPLAPVEGAVAGCTSFGWFEYTGLEVDFGVFLFSSDEEAAAQAATETAADEAWFADWSDSLGSMVNDPSYDPSVDFNRGSLDEFGVAGGWWSVGGAEDRVLMTAGPFMLYGVADNLGFDLGEKGADGYRRPITLIEELITPMVETVDNIERIAGSATGDTKPGAGVPVVPPAGGAVVPPAESGGGADEPVEPGKAAGQAVAGLIAAAAMGAIGWAEAGAEIGNILGGRGGAGTGAPPAEPPPFIDPYDHKPLDVDPATGMVFWPWDGGEGHWVDRADVPALIDEWNRELDAETARRVSRHEAQAEKDWSDLRRRTREQTQAELDRIAAEQERRRRELAVADRIRDIAEEADFDAMVSWLDKNPVPTGPELEALRRALGRHLGDDEAIGRLPGATELLGEAVRRTLGADAAWDRDHITWADVADFIGQPGLGTALRNPEATARVAAAIVTGGWSEAAVIPLVDVPRALEEANAAREAAGLPDITAEEARSISNWTIIKAITIDQALERGIPLAAGALGGGNAAAREAAEEALDAATRRAGRTASEAMEGSARRVLPGDEGWRGVIDEGAGASGRGGDEFGTLGRGGGEPAGPVTSGADDALPSGGRAGAEPPAPPTRTRAGGTDELVKEPGAVIPGRPPPPGAHPPPAPRGPGDELVREAGAHRWAEPAAGVQRGWAEPPPRVIDVEDVAAQPASDAASRFPGLDSSGIEHGEAPAGTVPEFGPEFGPRRVIESGAPPPSSTPSSVPPPDLGRNQELMEGVLRGEHPSGASIADDVQLRGDEPFAGTGHAAEGGWSPEAIGREETFWRSDGTPIPGPTGVDVEPPPKGFTLQVNPRTRTATPRLGTALTQTERARLLRPGGPVERAVRRINQTLDDLEPPS